MTRRSGWVLMSRIEEGIRQSENDETVSETEARAYLSRWGAGVSPAAAR